MNIIVFNLVLFIFGHLYNDVLAQNYSQLAKGIKIFKDCLNNKYTIMCLKEKALTILNDTLLDDRPMYLGFLEIEKDPNYLVNSTEDAYLPDEFSKRSSRLSDILVEKLEEFFKSRTVKLNLSNAFEGRKGGGGAGGGGGGKGGKGGGGMMAMMAWAGMGAMMVNMMMGKMAIMAGSALMLAKISLILSVIMIVKKMQGNGGGGGGEEKHIVYATSSDGGHSHGGGGGWHRSLDDAHNMVYRNQWGPSSTENGSGL